MRRGLRDGLAVTLSALALAATAPAATAGPGATPAPTVPPARDDTARLRLSDERTRSTWAYLLRRTAAHAGPDRRSRVVARLATSTDAGSPDLVLALEQRRDAAGRVWVRARLPVARGEAVGWLPRRHLGTFRRVSTHLRIDRRRLRATLLRGGRPVWRAPIGVGERRWPTPAGRFYVREGLVPRPRGSIYGVYAFGLSAYSRVLTDWPGGGQVGIHGTDQPELLPGRVSHGCIRLTNRRITRLRRLMPLGTPVEIR